MGLTGPAQMTTHQQTVRPNIVVVTSIGSEHISFFGSLENTCAEKVKMLTNLGADGVAILNGDDRHVMWMASSTQAGIVTFALHESNTI